MGQDVDEFQEVVLARKVPAHVQHDAAVGEVRPVFDDGGRDRAVLRVPFEVGERDGGVIGAVVVVELDADRAVQPDPVPAMGHVLGREHGDVVVIERGRALERLDFLQPGNHVVGGEVGGLIVKRMHRFRREKNVFHLHGNGFLAFDLEVETFRGAALVHQGAGLVAEDHVFPAGIRRRGTGCRRGGGFPPWPLPAS